MYPNKKLLCFISGWVDDSIFIRRPNQEDDPINASVNAGAFTTGRQNRGRQPQPGPATPVGPPPVKPRSQVGAPRPGISFGIALMRTSLCAQVYAILTFQNCCYLVS